MIECHINNMRIPKTLTLEESLLADVERTKGERSTSERVNELLKRALDLEREHELEREAARFYSDMSDRQEERSFLKASLRSITRD
jgi:Arc/MetJ family transcription regulator